MKKSLKSVLLKEVGHPVPSGNDWRQQMGAISVAVADAAVSVLSEELSLNDMSSDRQGNEWAPGSRKLMAFDNDVRKLVRQYIRELFIPHTHMDV